MADGEQAETRALTGEDVEDTVSTLLHGGGGGGLHLGGRLRVHHLVLGGLRLVDYAREEERQMELKRPEEIEGTDKTRSRRWYPTRDACAGSRPRASCARRTEPTEGRHAPCDLRKEKDVRRWPGTTGAKR